MALLSVIRRWHYRDHLSIREIAKRNRYSVPASFANRPVSVRLYPDCFLVVAEGQLLCEHQRINDRSHDKPGRTIYDWRHYLAVVQRKPGALRNGALFLELPAPFQQINYATVMLGVRLR